MINGIGFHSLVSRVLLTCVLSLLVFLLCSASNSQVWAIDADPREPSHLYVALTDPLGTLDPAVGYDWGNYSVISAFYDGLMIQRTVKSQPELHLAKHYTLSPDQRTHTFELHRNVMFHHGRELVADDVKYSLERMTNPAMQSPGRAFFRSIEGYEAQERDPSKGLSGIKVLGKYKLSITTSNPDAILLYALTTNFGLILPRDGEHTDGFRVHPVGTGAFQFDHWTKEQALVIKKNPTYFVPGLPKMDTVTFLTKQPLLSSISRLERGEIHLIARQAVTQNYSLIRSRQAPRYKEMLLPHTTDIGTAYVAMNTQKAPLSHRSVRIALNMAINKQAIVNIFEGRSRIATQILPPGLPSHESDYQGYSYDPKEAKALLRDAGLADGFSTNLLLLNQPMQKNIALLVQRDLARIGVRVNVQVVSLAELLACASQQGCAELVLSEGLAWIADYLEASNFYLPLFSPRSARQTSNSWNWSFYENPSVDRLSRQAISLVGAQNADKRTAIWRKAFRQIMDDAPWIPLYHFQTHFLVSPQINDRSFAQTLWNYFPQIRIGSSPP